MEISLSTILFFLSLLLFLRVLYKVILKPYLKIALIKFKFKDQVHSFFYPIVGHFIFFQKFKTKNPITEMLSTYLDNQNPKTPIKFMASNVMDKIQYVLNDNDMVQQFLVKKVHLYEKQRVLALHDISVYEGQVFAEGDRHKKMKKIMTNVFHFQALEKMLPSIINSAQHHLTQKLENHAKSKNEQNISLFPHFSSYTGEIVSDQFFGEEFGKTIIAGKPVTEIVCKSVQQAMQLAFSDAYINLRGAVMGHQDTNRIPDFLRSKKEIECKNQLIHIRNIISQAIQKRIDSFENDKKSEKHKDFLHYFLEEYFSPQNAELSDTDNSKFTLEIILQQYITLFFAGTDTTASFLTNSVYYLVKYPEIQDKIRKEIKENIPNSSQVTLEQLKNLKTMDNFGNEVLRVSPVVGQLFPRVALKDHYLGDLQIKKGDLVNANIFGSANNPIYVPNKDEFDIYRWEDPKFLNNLPTFASIQFSGGPRTCTGNHLAKIEYKVALIHILEKFRIVQDEKADLDLHMNFEIINMIKNDKMFKFIPL